MKEFYFTTSHVEPIRPTVIGFRQESNVWKKYIEFRRHGEITFSPDGKRQAPVQMGPMVNSGTLTAHPFIAPDESYLIWDSKREGGYGDSDLYISFREKDGTWGPAINIGDKVNSDKWDAYATVTPDGKYILFNRGIDDDNDNVDIYWVDAKVIENLRPKS